MRKTLGVLGVALLISAGIYLVGCKREKVITPSAGTQTTFVSPDTSSLREWKEMMTKEIHFFPQIWAIETGGSINPPTNDVPITKIERVASSTSKGDPSESIIAYDSLGKRIEVKFIYEKHGDTLVGRMLTICETDTQMNGLVKSYTNAEGQLVEVNELTAPNGKVVTVTGVYKKDSKGSLPCADVQIDFPEKSFKGTLNADEEHSTLIDDIAEFTHKNTTITTEVSAANDVVVCELARLSVECSKPGSKSKIGYLGAVVLNVLTLPTGAIGSIAASTIYEAIHDWIHSQ